MPARQLENTDLQNGWVIGRRITLTGTGGHHSVCYEVNHSNGDKAFLKALDIAKAFQANNQVDELQRLTSMFQFEREVLEKCKGQRLSRVVIPLATGTVRASGTPDPFNRVPYLIFKMAIGDLRHQENELNLLNDAWCLRSMHQTAVGLQQLHSKEIFHQDLKPSNVLVFEGEGIKISDLGNSFDPSMYSPIDAFPIAGATDYAPLDRRFAGRPPDLNERFAIDIYLLGSLFFFYFLQVSATQAIMTKLKSMDLEKSLTRDITQNMPFFQRAFAASVDDLHNSLAQRVPNVAEDIKAAVIEMCNPDPNIRGNQSQKHSGGNPFRMQRYVSKLDLLATKVELGLR